MGILHVFNTGVVRELVSTTTNVTPDDMFRGKWVLMDMSPAEWGDIGKFISSGWKYLTQRAVLRRHATDGDAIHVIWCDEAQQFVNSHDAHYLAQCRSHKGCMVYLTQSLHSYYSAMQGEKGRHHADALLTNFHHKVFHALGDEQTGDWAIRPDRQGASHLYRRFDVAQRRHVRRADGLQQPLHRQLQRALREGTPGLPVSKRTSHRAAMPTASFATASSCEAASRFPAARTS